MRAVFLTVADPNIGLGHLYRCDALATALAEKGAVVSFAVDCRAGHEWLVSRAPGNPWMIKRWTDDPDTTLAAIANADRLIVDAYDIEGTVREAISETVPDPVYFDDYGSNIPERGIVINGSPGAHLIDILSPGNCTGKKAGLSNGLASRGEEKVRLVYAQELRHSVQGESSTGGREGTQDRPGVVGSV